MGWPQFFGTQLTFSFLKHRYQHSLIPYFLLPTWSLCSCWIMHYSLVFIDTESETGCWLTKCSEPRWLDQMLFHSLLFSSLVAPISNQRDIYIDFLGSRSGAGRIWQWLQTLNEPLWYNCSICLNIIRFNIATKWMKVCLQTTQLLLYTILFILTCLYYPC